MLLCTGRAVNYKPPEVLANFFDVCKYPKTGFTNAMMQSSTDLSQAVAVPLNKKWPLNPAVEDDLTIQSQ